MEKNFRRSTLKNFVKKNQPNYVVADVDVVDKVEVVVNGEVIVDVDVVDVVDQE